MKERLSWLNLIYTLQQSAIWDIRNWITILQREGYWTRQMTSVSFALIHDSMLSNTFVQSLLTLLFRSVLISVIHLQEQIWVAWEVDGNP